MRGISRLWWIALPLVTSSAPAQLFQQAYIKASNTHALNSFGFSVAISGDSLAVASPGENSAATGINGDQSDQSAPGAGAVYVLVRDAAGHWSQQAYVKASNTDPSDEFGFSVAISVDTLLVGATGEASKSTGINSIPNNLGEICGAAYVLFAPVRCGLNRPI